MHGSLGMRLLRIYEKLPEEKRDSSHMFVLHTNWGLGTTSPLTIGPRVDN